METRHSVCALLVQVENGRAIKLRGDPGHPVTRGFLCGKAAKYSDRECSPELLLYPAIAREFGLEAILPYSYAMDRRFFHRLGASRRDRTICSSAGGHSPKEFGAETLEYAPAVESRLGDEGLRWETA